MDPHSGDVYAMATYPWFDPNDFSGRHPVGWQPRGHRHVRTRVGQQDHHGGGRTGDRLGVPRRTVPGPASMTVGPFTIHDSHVHPTETMTLGDIIAESSNIGVRHRRRRGRQRPARCVHAATSGTGSTTGDRVPGRGRGRDAADDRLGRHRPARRSPTGQGIAVTPMQMADGLRHDRQRRPSIQPRLVRGSVDADGTSARPRQRARSVVMPPPTRRPADPDARLRGRGRDRRRRRRSPGYQVAGKTGTVAQASTTAATTSSATWPRSWGSCRHRDRGS